MEGRERKCKQALRFISLGKNDPNYVKKITFEPLILLEWINNPYNTEARKKERIKERKNRGKKQSFTFICDKLRQFTEYLAWGLHRRVQLHLRPLQFPLAKKGSLFLFINRGCEGKRKRRSVVWIKPFKEAETSSTCNKTFGLHHRRKR